MVFSSGACMYGAEKGLINLCAALDDRFEITVILPDNGPLAEILKKRGYRVRRHPLAVLSSGQSLPRMARYLLLSSVNTLYTVIYAVLCGYDCIVANTLLLLPPLLAARLCGKKHIWFFREYTPSFRVNRFLSRLALIFSDRIICMSENIREEMFGDMEWGGEKTAVIHEPLPFFSARQARPEPLRRELAITRSEVIILLPARIHPSKGQLEFLRDYAGILRKHEVMVLMAGDCSAAVPRSVVYMEEIRRFINKGGLKDRVTLLGFREDIDTLFALCDICVFPILRNEPFGIAFQEALSCGKRTLYYSSKGLEEAASFFNGHKAVKLDSVSLELAITSALSLRAAVAPDYEGRAIVSSRIYREGILRIVTSGSRRS